MAAALALLGRAVGLADGARRLLRCGGMGLGTEGRAGSGLPSVLTVGVARRGCGVGRAAEAGRCRAMSSAERPKRPLSAYFRFLRDNQPTFRQQNPGRAASDGRTEIVREKGAGGSFSSRQAS